MIAIIGKGRMGRTLANILSAQGRDFVMIGRNDDKSVLNSASVVIDFSLPCAFDDNLAACVKRRVPLVLGTTGLDTRQQDNLAKATQHIAIVASGNYSIGINLMTHLCAVLTKTLDGDIEIIEKHHRHKLDAPSGTALMLYHAINSAIGVRDLMHGRHGKTARGNEIGMHAVRGGEIIGEHSVMVANRDEIVEISHKAQSREVFAKGALAAADWVINQSAGLYDMQDVLGLNL